MEYKYVGSLAIRVGYRGTKYDDLTGLKGLTTRVGMVVKKIGLSYALMTLKGRGEEKSC